MKKIKIIQVGLGTVGQGVVRGLLKKDWAEIVGVVDTAKDKAGHDVGDILGLNKKLGITVNNDANKLYADTAADVVISSTSNRSLRQIYPEVIAPMERGLNVITPCMDVSDPFLYDPDIAAKIEKCALKNNVTFLGIGSTQLADRVVFALTETCDNISKITFTVHADVSKFPDESRREEFGVGHTSEGYQRALEAGDIKGYDVLNKEVQLIAENLGWQLDRIQQKIDPVVENGIVTGVVKTYDGIIDGLNKISCIYKFIIDPNHEYRHELHVDGTPAINAKINYSADRGIVGTIVPLINSIPFVVGSKPGILRLTDLPIGIRQ